MSRQRAQDQQNSSGFAGDETAAFEALFLRVIKGEDAPWSHGHILNYEDAVRQMRFHGIAHCLARSAGQNSGPNGGSMADWPDELQQAIRSDARMQGLWETSHKHCVSGLLDALAAANIEAVLIKGTALAYLVYPDPAMRRRGDTDLIIRPDDLTAARDIFVAQGWRCGIATSTQENWSFDSRSGFDHVIDLHWQANSSPALRGVFSPDEAIAVRIALPGLSTSAYALKPSLLFLATVLNQAMHEQAGYLVDDESIYGEERLIWTMDIHLLADSFDQSAWEDLMAQANQKGGSRLCYDALVRAQLRFDTQVPSLVLEQLGKADRQGALDAFFFEMSAFNRFRAGWIEAFDWRERGEHLRRNLFMSADLLRRKYPGMARFPLPFLHGRRLFGGMLRNTPFLLTKPSKNEAAGKRS